jgi:4-hydroxy-tetrahydrodipicolinate synthase
MPHLPKQFGGIVPPLSTPFTPSFEIDVVSLQRLIEFQLAAGVHGIFILGSTGEAAFLTDQQRAKVIEVAVHTIGGQVPLFVGIFDMTTARVLEHAQTARRLGASALVLTAPFYTRISQIEILEHFRLVHTAVDFPVLAYDIPAAVSIKIAHSTMLSMAEEGLINGIKDSSSDEANFRALLMALGDRHDFSLFTGSELLVDTALLCGADGCVPGLGNVDPVGYVRLYQAAKAGDWQRARHEQERLFRLFDIASVGLPRMSIGSSAMGGFKTALKLRGIIDTNITGRPSIQLNSEEVERVRQILIAAGLL